jgi:hypothetical protein
MIITDSVNGLDVSIMVEDPWKKCYLTIEHTRSKTVITDHVYDNALILSASLRDTLGLGPAIDFLTRNRVPKTHPLWDLNHSDLWER